MISWKYKYFHIVWTWQQIVPVESVVSSPLWKIQTFQFLRRGISFASVLVSCCCCNILLWTWGYSTTQACSLTVLEDRSLHCTLQGWFLLEAPRESLFLCLCQFLVAADLPGALPSPSSLCFTVLSPPLLVIPSAPFVRTLVVALRAHPDNPGLSVSKSVVTFAKSLLP